MRKLFYLLIVALLIHGGSSANTSFAQAVGCPTVTVEVARDDLCRGKPLTFTAKVAGLDSGIKLNYEWTVSVGTIEGGQGTDTITVETVGIAGQSVNATVKVTGINTACANSASQEMRVAGCGHIRIFDQYGNIDFEEEKARLDNVASQLENEPEVKAYIVAYGGRITFAGEAVERADRAKNYLTGKYNFLDDRIITIDGGYREDLTIEILLWPKEMEQPPIASPTLGPEDVQIIERPTKSKPRRRRNR